MNIINFPDKRLMTQKKGNKENGGNLVQRMMLIQYYLIFMSTIFINNFFGSKLQELTKSALK